MEKQGGGMICVGGVELGGTKIRVAFGGQDGNIERSMSFATAGPDESFVRIREFFASGPSIAAIGIGAFGPVVLDPHDPDYAQLKGTPKPGWTGFDIAAAVRSLGAPLALDTDVAAAGLAEHRRGALAGLDCGVYLTVGTGIGGALVIEGRPVKGALHPEVGHLPLARAAGDDAPSFCSYHPNCAEGLASGPAIERRYRARLSDLPADHPGRALIAHYAGQLAASLVLVASPRRIVIGGGVAKTDGFHPAVHSAMLASLNGYAIMPAITSSSYIVPPALGDDSGLIGALLMAGEASHAKAED